MTKDQFYIEQRIKLQVDDGEGPYWMYGHVKEIHADRIMIKWPDFTDLVASPEDEWESIKLGNPGIE